MYLSIPDVFFIPVYYVEKDILNIGKIMILQELNTYNNLTNKTIKRKDVVLGVALPDQIAPRWYKERKFMEEYAKSNGITIKIENANFDVVKQASQVDDLISQGIDVLILVPLNLFTAADLVEKAHKAGVKVVDYDRLIQNSDADVFISFNGLKIGELQGQYLTKEVPRGNYIILSGDPGNLNSKLYREGAMEYIEPLAARGNIKIVSDKAVEKWDPKIAFNIVKDALIANDNKIDAILAPNDVIAGAAIQALEEQGLAGKVIVTGMDADLAAAQRIVQGTQAMTIFKDTRQLGKAAIDTAIKLASKKEIAVDSYINNGKIDVPSILLTPIVVNKYNINQTLIDSGYLKQSEVYKM